MATGMASPILLKWDYSCSGKLVLCPVAVSSSVSRWAWQSAAVGRCGMHLQSYQLFKNWAEIGSQRRIRRLISPVMDYSVRPTSDEGPSTDELKAELEALLQEASQARDRYESSRARFMRLAQVAEQLQQRAVFELKLGNDGNARQLLTEKKKVMGAADISKRRSQLYEVLSNKLSEAISEKESQLMAALASAPSKVTTDEAPTVRVIFPKENDALPVEEVFEEELERILASGVDGQAPPFPPQEESVNGDSRAFTDAQRDGHTDIETVRSPDDLLGARSFGGGHETAGINQRESTDDDTDRTDLGDNHQVFKPAKEDRHGQETSAWQEMESAAKDLERDVLCLQEESERLATQLESVFSDDEDDADSSLTNEGEYVLSNVKARLEVPASGEENEAEREVGMKEESEEPSVVSDEEKKPKVDAKLVFEEYLLDMDSQVAGLETKLQNFVLTADILLGSNSDKKDERVVLVKDLLQQVHNLRTRILDGVNMSIGQQSQ
ncbi:hypothetical protein R1sor_021638 [Riccia sorocarpa]|uniref:BAG domain-containing protein n=1 Tax=Riccia sorocarpa TaxID=122646 RepID=A0ABD3GKK9_9MARC